MTWWSSTRDRDADPNATGRWQHVDTEGYIWSSAADGVHCYAPDGRLLGKILVPEAVANVTFGGPERNRLFVTATSSLYSIYLDREGAQRP